LTDETTDREDRRWLDAAARLAWRARPASSPNPPVGAIIVADGRTAGLGWTADGGRPHAEARALAEAGELARGATAYVTLEPCAHRSPRGPACADLLIEAGVSRVVVAIEDPDPRTAGNGLSQLSEAGIAVRLVDSAEAERSLEGYLTRAKQERPHTTLKLAMSLDGRIATASGESRWITGPEARAHVHARRAQCDAIVVGGETWRQDRPRLDVRLPGLAARSLRRFVLSRSEEPEGVTVLRSPASLGGHTQLQHAYVEGGAGAAAAFFAEDLIDRLDIYRAPIIIGGGSPAIADFGLRDLATAHGRWRLVEALQLGSDRYEAYHRVRALSPAD
jgi:diaminohydroxyphosphoribosylaminopyrimidine deaminase/5-amino-6-(5-phosphoribosylamino)uracil reductase